MTLRDVMTADVGDVFLNADDFAVAATLLPSGAATGCAVLAVPSDQAESFLEVGVGHDRQRRVTVLVSRAVVRTGLAGIEGAERDARRGDALRIDAGGFVGRWLVEAVRPDDQGGLTLELVEQRHHAAAGREVIRP